MSAASSQLELDRAARARPNFAGELEVAPLPDLLALLAATSNTGLLELHSPEGRRELVFERGALRGARSQRAGERVGEVALALGLMRPEALRDFETDVQRRGFIGRDLVERGLLSEDDLWRVLQEHLIRIVAAVVRDGKGLFAFFKLELPHRYTLPAMRVERVLLEAMSHIDDAARGDCAPAPGAQPACGAGSESAPRAEAPAASCDRSDGADAALRCFDTATRLVVSVARAYGAGDPLARACATAFRGENGAVARLALGEDGALPIAAISNAARADGAAGATARDRCLDAALRAVLFLLFVAGEHLPREVHAELHAQVKALIDRALE